MITFRSNYFGLISQGCFYTGCVIGSAISPSILKLLATVKTLMICTLVSSLFPIVFPISEIWEDWILMLIIAILSFFSGVGSSIILITHALPMIKLQQSFKRSCCIGAQTGLIYVPGIISGFLICFPSIFTQNFEPWIFSLLAGIFAICSIGVNLCIDDEEVLVSINKGITLHHLSFFLSYFSIGV